MQVEGHGLARSYADCLGLAKMQVEGQGSAIWLCGGSRFVKDAGRQGSAKGNAEGLRLERCRWRDMGQQGAMLRV